jgi:hypothetical protein
MGLRHTPLSLFEYLLQPACCNEEVLRDAEPALDRVQEEVRPEQCAGHEQQRVHLVPAAACHLQQGVGDEADAYADGDRERKGHEHHCQEGSGCHLEVILPADVGDLLEHDQADHHQRRCRRLARDDSYQGREEHRDQEAETRHDTGETGTRSICHTGSRLDVRGRCGGGRSTTGHGADRVHHQQRGDVLRPPVLVDKTTFFGNRHRSTHGVEEVGQEERQGEDDERRPTDRVDGVADREVAEQPEIRSICPVIRKLRHVQRPACRVRVTQRRPDIHDALENDREDRPEEDADEQCALGTADVQHQHDGERDAEDHDRPAIEPVSDAELQRHRARLSRDPPCKPCIDESDEHQEQPDADGDGVLESSWDGVEQRRTHPCCYQQNRQQTLDHHDAHRTLPAHLRSQLEGHDAVEAEAGGHGDRHLTNDPHQDAHHRGHTGRSEGHLKEVERRPVRHGLVGAGQDDRVQHHDVGHREEGGETAPDLSTHGRTASTDFKESVQTPPACHC